MKRGGRLTRAELLRCRRKVFQRWGRLGTLRIRTEITASIFVRSSIPVENPALARCKGANWVGLTRLARVAKGRDLLKKAVF